MPGGTAAGLGRTGHSRTHAMTCAKLWSSCELRIGCELPASASSSHLLRPAASTAPRPRATHAPPPPHDTLCRRGRAREGEGKREREREREKKTKKSDLTIPHCAFCISHRTSRSHQPHRARRPQSISRLPPTYTHAAAPCRGRAGAATGRRRRRRRRTAT